VESELVLITPVARTLTDPALAEFAKYAKEKWNITVRTSALAAGTPVAYGRIVEWKGRPEADIFWGGETALFEKLTEQNLIISSTCRWQSSIPSRKALANPIAPGPKGSGSARCSSPKVWSITKLFERLGVPPPRTHDLLNPAQGQCRAVRPDAVDSSHATYEVILSAGATPRAGMAETTRGNTGIFTARSRDVPSVVAKGEFAAGFAVPSYMAFEDRLAGFDIKFVAPKTAWITPEPIAILAGAKHAKAARAFIEFMLSERGQRVAMERGVFPITPKYRVQGAPGSTAEAAVEFTGGIRSYFDREVTNIYVDAVAQARYEQVNSQFRKDIESVWDQLKKK
jgi:iron(III) transport system substrate-binding protein